MPQKLQQASQKILDSKLIHKAEKRHGNRTITPYEVWNLRDLTAVIDPHARLGE